MTAAPVDHGVPWWERAACRGVDLEVFFPHSSGQISGRTVRPAAARCVACPVQRQCLAEGLRPTPYMRRGIWGGWLFGEKAGTPPLDILHRAGLTARPRNLLDRPP